MTSPTPEAVRSALCQRLSVAAEVLVADEVLTQALADATAGDDSERAARLLDALVASVQATPEPHRAWLLLTAVCAAFPTLDEVTAFRRTLELQSVTDASLSLLHDSLGRVAVGSPTARLELVDGGIVADVDYSARHDLHTGIQRTVRELAPRWVRSSDVVLAAWTPGYGALRRLNPFETRRVLHWGEPGTGRRGAAAGDPGGEPADDVLVVPWRGTLVLPEVPMRDAARRLAGLAATSGIAVVAIGYDCIPIVTADLLPPAEAEKFAGYLAMLKYATEVVAISESAAEEFRGFADMLPSQGLSGPRVVACPLPVNVPPGQRPDVDAATPTVLVVGSHEPRKNHVAVLWAAGQLWAEGHRFSLRFIGGSGWSTEEFDAELAHLRAAGRDVTVSRSVGDAELWSAYRAARFSVFCSLHEGFGLPVAESLACGTPALTSDVGSMAEIARDGGAITVDPRDDEAVRDGMRRLLVDDALLDRLRAEALARPPRTWDDYSRETWAHVVRAGTAR